LLRSNAYSNGAMESISLMNCHLGSNGTLDLFQMMVMVHASMQKKKTITDGFFSQLRGPQTSEIASSENVDEIVFSTVCLKGCMIGPGGAAILTEILVGHNKTNNILCNLTSLDLSSNRLGDLGCAKLAQSLAACGHLALLDLSNNAISSHGVACMCDGLGAPLHESRIPPKDMGVDTRQSTLRTLRFNQNPRIGNMGFGIFLHAYLRSLLHRTSSMSTAIDQVRDVQFASSGIDCLSGRLEAVYEKLITYDSKEPPRSPDQATLILTLTLTLTNPNPNTYLNPLPKLKPNPTPWP
jgi:hypothetical protein